MKMQFIDLIDAKGRASHLAVNDTDGPEFLRVGGVLEHGAMIRPRTATDALHLIAWTRQHFGLSDPAADLAALREALRDLAAMADGQRQTFNELWEVVETLRPGRDLGGDAAVIRGGYLSIADKARAVLSRTERRSA